MKHAFLIYAHEDPFVLHILLNLLDDERNEIFLHIDPRQQEAMQTALNPSPSVMPDFTSSNQQWP